MYDARELFDQQNAKADEGLRGIVQSLPEAVATCVDAAQADLEEPRQIALMKVPILAPASASETPSDLMPSHLCCCICRDKSCWHIVFQVLRTLRQHEAPCLACRQHAMGGLPARHLPSLETPLSLCAASCKPWSAVLSSDLSLQAGLSTMSRCHAGGMLWEGVLRR